MIDIDIKININENEIGKRIDKRLDSAQFALDEQVLKDSNTFIPAREWYLRNSGSLHSRIGEGLIAWQTPYARRLYYNPQFNFSKDENPNAQGLWYEVAKARFGDDWIDITQDAYDKG